MESLPRRRLRDLLDQLQALVAHGDLLADEMSADDPRRGDVEAMARLAHDAGAIACEVEQMLKHYARRPTALRSRRRSAQTAARSSPRPKRPR